MDYFQYFDKHPLHAFSLGPTQSGVSGQQPYSVEWSGYYSKNEGFFVKNPSYSTIYKTSLLGNPDSFSFSFNTGQKINFALGSGQMSSIYLNSGNNYLNFQFSGIQPQLINMCSLKTNSDETVCFYLKNNSGVYSRTSATSFGVETPIFTGARLKRFNSVSKLPSPNLYRMGLFGLDEDANGKLFISDKYYPIETGFYQDFTSLTTGIINKIPLWPIEEDSITNTTFLNRLIIKQDSFEDLPTGDFLGNSRISFFYSFKVWKILSNFESFPTGQISGDYGFSNVQKGIFNIDNFENYITGSVNSLTSGYNIYGGFFING